jgi:hypothetical protein
VGKLAGSYPKEWIEYITTKRVEINSVTEALNDNEEFWNWIVDKLRTIVKSGFNNKKLMLTFLDRRPFNVL